MAASCTIVWFRRDLRVEDNPALAAAARAGPVIPVFIWSPAEEGQFRPGRVSRWWLKQSLSHLDTSLRNLGSPLIMRKAHRTLSVLLDIVGSTGATQVFYNHLYDPVSLVRDHRVKQGLLAHGIVVETFNGDLLYEPWEVYNDNGEAFTTYDAYWEKCLNMPFEPEAPLLPPKRLTGPKGKHWSCSADELGLEDASERDSNALLARAWSPGWRNGAKSLEAFFQGPLLEYATDRGKADSASTSYLSPHLHFGEVSVRKLFHQLRMKQVTLAGEGMDGDVESVNLFLRAIGFREYSRYLCFNFPFTHERSLLANLRFFPWRIDEGYFKAWRQGRTGYPLVDAGMRELWATGWLHNRIRVVVSSFFVKFLQLPWRWGMKYFWDTLLDADLECDVLGWQYISGSLPDGHELDRMWFPQIEGNKYDPEGEYVRRWLPELSRLPTEWIHHPWDAPPIVLRAAGIELGGNYPKPMVDLEAAKERLQAALVEMWEREAALKAVLASGEEALVDTIEVSGTGGPFHGRIDVHKVIVRQKIPSGSFLRDQLVPSMPTESQLQAAAAILHQSPSVVHDAEEATISPVSLPTPPSSGTDLDSTAESASGVGEQYAKSGSVAVPVWLQGVSGGSQPCTPAQVVPEVCRGGLSRRHLHSVQRVNMEAVTSNKPDEDCFLPKQSAEWTRPTKRQARQNR